MGAPWRSGCVHSSGLGSPFTTENERHKRYLRDRLEQLGVADNYQRTLALQQTFNAERESQFPYLREHEYALVRDEAARSPSPATED